MAVRPLQFQASRVNNGGTVMQEARRARLKKQRWNAFCQDERNRWLEELAVNGRMKRLFDPVSGDRFRRFVKFADELNENGTHLMLVGYDNAGDIMEVRLIQRKAS